MSYATKLTMQMMELLESRHNLQGIVIIPGKEDGRDHFALCRNGRIGKRLCSQVTIRRQVSRKEKLFTALEILELIKKSSLHPCGNCMAVISASL